MNPLALLAYSAVIVLVLAVLVLVAVVLTRRYRKAQADKKAQAALDPAGEVRAACADARTRLAQKVPEPEARAALGRFLMLGEPGSGKSTLLAATGLNVPLTGGPSAGPGAVRAASGSPACAFWLLGKGLVVEARGKLLATAGDEDTEKESFAALLEGLRRDRPDRPLDGILLAIPCHDLLSGAAEAPEEQQHKARVLRRRIVEAQQALEMCAPIYLIVTQCDLITGFASFAAELDPALRQDVVGWSSPHSLSASVSAGWVDEAFDRIHRTLVREQSRRFAGDRPVRAMDEFFLFPTELGALREPLAACVGEIFAPSAAEEPLALRGIYFTGDGSFASMPPAAPSQLAPSVAATAADPGRSVPPPALDPAAPARSILFVRELFERKIFAEGNIARPSPRAIKRRKQAILGLQIAAACLMLLFSGLLSWASSSLEQETASLLPFLQSLSGDLLEMKGERQEGEASVQKRKAQASGLFDGLQKIGTNRLRTALLPASLVSGIDGRVESAVSVGYKRVILEAFHDRLEQKGAPLAALPAVGATERRPATIEDSPEFQRLEEWLQELKTFEEDVERYNGLLDPLSRAGSRSAEEKLLDVRVQSVTALARNLLEKKVTPSFSAAYYHGALARGAELMPLSLEPPYRERVRKKADVLFGAVNERMLDIYRQEPIRRDFEELAKGLRALKAGGPEYTPQKLWALSAAINRAEQDLKGPMVAWVASEGLPPSPGLERVLGMVKDANLLGEKSQRELKAEGDRSLQRFREAFSPQADAPWDPLTERKDGGTQMQLRSFVTALKEPTEALRKQSFMSGDGDEPALPEETDAARIFWNVDGLKEVVKLPKDYEAYLEGGGLRPWKELDVEETIKDLTERTLKARVFGGVTRAAERGYMAAHEELRGEVVRADIANYAQASAPLRETVASFARLKMSEARDRLLKLLRTQGGRLLGLAQGILESPPLYRVRDGSFAWWNGEGQPVLEAFGVADPAELTEYVGQQRTRAETVAKELAEPVLAVMQAPEVAADPASVPGITGWQRVISPLKDYADKKSNNSVSNLERFLATELPGITLDNCLSNLRPRASGQLATDYFTDRRQRIRALLRERCVELSRDNIRTSYADLRRVFERDLAGRFPFQKIEAGTRIEDASPEVTFRFLRDATDFTRRYRSVLVERKDPSASAVVRFLDKLEQVRHFLAPFLSQAEAVTDGFYEVKLDFRANQAREVGGNQIAAWTMKVAEEQLVLGGPKSVSRWRLGEPVRLHLRWARNGPDVPVRGGSADASMTIKEREVSFEERGAWALLRMIAGHQISNLDAAEGGDPSGHVLLFVVRTIPDPSGGFVDRVGADGGVVRVFMRLGLFGGEKDKPLKYPTFPETAPALN